MNRRLGLTLRAHERTRFNQGRTDGFGGRASDRLSRRLFDRRRRYRSAFAARTKPTRLAQHADTIHHTLPHRVDGEDALAVRRLGAISGWYLTGRVSACEYMK